MIKYIIAVVVILVSSVKIKYKYIVRVMIFSHECFDASNAGGN